MVIKVACKVKAFAGGGQANGADADRGRGRRSTTDGMFTC